MSNALAVEERAANVLDRANQDGAVAEVEAALVIVTLANLSEIAYDQCREAEAEKLGIRVTTLDVQVERKRKELFPTTEGGQELEFPSVIPYADPVDGAALLHSLSASAKRFIVLPEHGAEVMALWTLTTHLIDSVEFAPILALSSPEKRCGKSTVLAWENKLVHKPMPSSNISPSAVFRSIEKWHPTLIIDEADSFLKDNEEMRGVLNSGHSRGTAYVVRVVESGGKHEPRRFSTWGAKVIALIGALPDTLHDRSIILDMRRKLPGENVEKIRHAPPGHFTDLLAKCVRFAMDNADKVKAIRPAVPSGLGDRAADNWEPLLAIADIAGGDWPEIARKAALVVSGSDREPDSLNVELLRDVQAFFTKHQLIEKVGSNDLITGISKDEDRPWATYNHGKPISPRQLASKLKFFKIKPVTVRTGDDTPKGYKKIDFEDAFRRYIPPAPPHDPQHRNKGNGSTTYAGFESDTRPNVLHIENTPKSLKEKECCAVADTKVKTGGVDF